ncbi:MAG: type III pantothenate kinase [Erysipelotrichia bacterium]|nr:type III pantothenate kinase [Erysipelotrichia bacterium]
MNMCIDVGNSTIAIGVFDGSQLANKVVINTDARLTADEFYLLFKDKLQALNIEIESIENIILSSVVPPINLMVINSIKKLFKREPMLVGPGTKTGLSISVDNPLEIGNDIIADLVGGKEKYGAPLLVVDLGTASKILLLDRQGTFISCLIMPGLTLSAQSLSTKAALLPKVSLIAPQSIMAKNTLAAMNAGIVYGHVDMILGLIKRYEQALGYSCQRILTGGGAVYLKDILKENFIYDLDLNLEGLNIIIEKNIK